MSSRTRRSYDIALDEEGHTFNISLSDPKELQADNLALATWGSSVILANVLHNVHVDLAGTGFRSCCYPVLELGAGTGLVGLCAAVVWRTYVVLTDLAPIVPNLEANILLNRCTLEKHNADACSAHLDWTAPEKLVRSKTSDCSCVEDSNKARVLLAADTIYSEEHPELLAKAIQFRLEPGQASRLILCYPLRVSYLDHIRHLWQLLEHLGLECLEEHREKLDDTWDEETPYEWCVWRWSLVETKRTPPSSSDR